MKDDRGFGVISESAAPFELLVVVAKLEKTSELVSSCLSRPFRKEKLVIIYWKSMYYNQKSVP